MRFAEGDHVRHRGLKFISGTMVRIMRVPDADMEDDRSYFCKVQLKNGQFYSDRATEWELSSELPKPAALGSQTDQEEPLYAEMG